MCKIIMICLHTGAYTHKHTQAHTNMIVYSYFEYLVNMEQICCLSKAPYFDTQKRNFTSNEKNIITRQVEMLYTFYEIEIEMDIWSFWLNVVYKIHGPTGIQLRFQ